MATWSRDATPLAQMLTDLRRIRASIDATIARLEQHLPTPAPPLPAPPPMPTPRAVEVVTRDVAVLNALALLGGSASRGELLTATKLTKHMFTGTIRRLVKRGDVRLTGTRRVARWHLTTKTTAPPAASRRTDREKFDSVWDGKTSLTGSAQGLGSSLSGAAFPVRTRR